MAGRRRSAPPAAPATLTESVPAAVQLLPAELVRMLQASGKPSQTAVKVVLGTYAPKEQKDVLVSLYRLFHPNEVAPSARSDLLLVVAKDLIENWQFVAQKA